MHRNWAALLNLHTHTVGDMKLFLSFFFLQKIRFLNFIYKIVIFCIQLRILAQDGGSPSRTAITIASITVQRNLYAPVFQILSKNETILETRQLGLPILQVKATDGDRRVSSWTSKIFLNKHSLLQFVWVVVLRYFRPKI